jgi:hypothetical protein
MKIQVNIEDASCTIKMTKQCAQAKALKIDLSHDFDLQNKPPEQN